LQSVTGQQGVAYRPKK